MDAVTDDDFCVDYDAPTRIIRAVVQVPVGVDPWAVEEALARAVAGALGWESVYRDRRIRSDEAPTLLGLPVVESDAVTTPALVPACDHHGAIELPENHSAPFCTRCGKQWP